MPDMRIAVGRPPPRALLDTSREVSEVSDRRMTFATNAHSTLQEHCQGVCQNKMAATVTGGSYGDWRYIACSRALRSGASPIFSYLHARCRVFARAGPASWKGKGGDTM